MSTNCEIPSIISSRKVLSRVANFKTYSIVISDGNIIIVAEPNKSDKLIVNKYNCSTNKWMESIKINIIVQHLKEGFYYAYNAVSHGVAASQTRLLMPYVT